jgi:hypothetical protein
MKKVKTETKEMRREYKKSDFPGGLVRGKYVERVARTTRSRAKKSS